LFNPKKKIKKGKRGAKMEKAKKYEKDLPEILGTVGG